MMMMMATIPLGCLLLEIFFQLTGKPSRHAPNYT